MVYLTLWLSSLITTAVPLKVLRNYFIVILVLIYWALISFRGGNVDADYYQYLDYIKDVTYYNIDSRGGHFFDYLVKLIYIAGLPVTIIFSFYALAVPLKVSLFARFSPYGHAIFISYVGFFIYLHDFTQIRAGLAIALGYWAVYLRSEKCKFWIFLAILSIFIHPSLFLLFAFVIASRFITCRLLFLIMLASVAIAYFNLLAPFIEIIVNLIGNKELTLYYHLALDGQVIKPFGIFALICLMCTLLIINYIPKFNGNEKLTILFVKMLLMSQIAWYLFYCVPVFAGRINQLFLYAIIFLLPILSKLIFRNYIMIPALYSLLGFAAFMYTGNLLNDYNF